MNATLEVVCYKSKTLKDGTHPLMLRIAKDYHVKYVSLGLSLNQKYWDFKKHQPKPNCPNKEYIDKLILSKKGQYQQKIIEFTAQQKDYTPQTLIHAVEQKTVSKTVADLYQDIISGLVKSGKIGNSQVYSYSLRSLQKFTTNRLSIPFADITVEWLRQYEVWLRDRGCGENTISQLFRTLRAVCNRALEMGLMPRETYPFGKFKVSKFSSITKKRAIGKQEILKIIKLDLSNKDFYTKLSRDIFVFSYLGAGINFTDLALLKPANISDGRVCYIRKKTGKKVHFKLSEGMQKILQNHIEGMDQRGYIFPILNEKEHETAQQIENRIHKVLGHVNKRLKKIGEMANVDGLTTYVARHSYATVLKRSGVNISIISESLGHSDLATTQIYLDSFENEQIDEAMKHLL